ncbi:DUF4283 domain-containing protein [Raphanus sativus]|nr:DUF4283 domain-containing protein [Raphanus sativus]
MFHTAQWNSTHSSSTPPLKAIKIWAHLTGVPLDLRHDEGLSLVAGLVGEPKETDEFTKSLVSLTVSHVKVEVDLTVPLPPVVEFERQSGEVVEVLVHYPWVPPTCSHCHELGHIVRNCLTYSPPAPPVPDTETTKTPSKNSLAHQSETNPKTPKKPPQKATLPKTAFTPAKAAMKNQKTHQKYQPVNKPSSSKPLPNPFSTPDPVQKPSLKRSRSSPTLSPPISLTANPFALLKPPDPDLSIQNPHPLLDNSFPPDPRGVALSEDPQIPPQ